jgi:hypothetical protein
MVGGSPTRRKMSAPRLSHHRQGLLREPGPSRRPDRPLHSLSQLSPEDTSPAHGLGSSTPGLVPLVDDLARAAEGSFTKREKPRAARPTEPRDSYASGIRIPHSSPSAQGSSSSPSSVELEDGFHPQKLEEEAGR